MTEAEWLACTDPEEMLRFLARKISRRKLRLFACACCRRVWHFIPDPRCQSAVLVAEEFADGLVDDAALEAAWREAKQGHKAFKTKGGPFIQPADFATSACVSATSKTVGQVVSSCYRAASAVQMRARHDAYRETPEDGQAVHLRDMAAWESERRAQADSLRGIIGNPFREAVVHERWRTPAVVALANTIYGERRFDLMAALGAALSDARCTETSILEHCSLPNHVRGCHVVDLILGKE